MRSDPPQSFRYCPSCGTELVGPGHFCSQCGFDCRPGSPSHGSTSERTNAERSTSRSDADESASSMSDRAVLERRISQGLADGWELEHDFGDHAVMINRSLGDAGTHVVIALFTIWWTAGVGNALYAAYCYFGAVQRVIVRPEGIESTKHTQERTGSGAATDVNSSGWSLAAIIGAAYTWFVAIMVGAIGVGVGFTGFGVFLMVVSLLLFVLGTAMFPPARRRLERRHGITTNGRTHSVDERIVYDVDEPCSGCYGTVGRGVERTYREDVCLFGVPITTSKGTNTYCRSCANGEGARDASRKKPDSTDESTTETELESA